MSRTIRNYNVNINDWEKPWHAIGDHNGYFFSARPKKYIKIRSSHVHRANEREMMFKIISDIEVAENIVINDYKRCADPWDIDWFRD